MLPACPGPEAPKHSALLRSGLVVPSAAKPFLHLEPSSTPAPLFPPSSHNRQAKCSHFKAACRLSHWCLHSKAFPTEWFSKESCLILWVSFPLYLTGRDQMLPLTNFGITAQSLAGLMLAAEAGGTKIGQLAMTRLGDGSKHGLFPGAFSFLCGSGYLQFKTPFEDDSAPRRNGGVRGEHKSSVEPLCLPSSTARPLCFLFCVKYFHMQKGLRNK